MTNEMFMAVAASIAAFGVLIGALIAVYRIAKRIDDALGLDKDGRTLSDRMDRVEHQLWENGGSSLADRVNNIEKHVVKVSTEIQLIKDITLGLQREQTDTSLIVSPMAKPIRKKKVS
jgi:biopolymer transport protein ExbB/TolQ